MLNKYRPRGTDKNLIRVGVAEGDGGYLIPNDTFGIDGLYSPGVDQLSEFELYFAELGTPCFLIDYSVDSAPRSHKNFHFQKLWLSANNEPNSITLEDWISEDQGQKTELVLQMDIEGAEWAVLEKARRSTLRRFRIIVVELHGFAGKFQKKHSWKLLRVVTRNLFRDHIPVHFHGNNCCGSRQVGEHMIPNVVELTLLRKDRVGTLRDHAKLPHPLDRPNIPANALPPTWK